MKARYRLAIIIPVIFKFYDMVREDDDVLIFAYESKKIFNVARLITSYRMRDLADKEGNLTGEPLAMTRDERDIFDVVVKNAAMIVVDELSKLAQMETEMFFIDKNRLIFNVTNYKKHNINTLNSIDIAIFNVLYNSCIAQFYDIVNQKEQAEIYRVKLAEAQSALHDRCFELRKIR